MFNCRTCRNGYVVTFKMTVISQKWTWTCEHKRIICVNYIKQATRANPISPCNVNFEGWNKFLCSLCETHCVLPLYWCVNVFSHLIEMPCHFSEYQLNSIGKPFQAL